MSEIASSSGAPTKQDAFVSQLKEMMPLIRSLAKSVWVKTAGLDYDDLVQTGTIEAWKRWQLFDPSTHGTTFPNYAWSFLLQAMRRQVWRMDTTVRTPRNQHIRGRRMKSLRIESLTEILVDPASVQTWADTPEHDYNPDDIQMGVLTNTEREIIRLYFYDRMTLGQIAKSVGGSHQEISTIKNNAIRKLKIKMRRSNERTCYRSHSPR